MNDSLTTLFRSEDRTISSIVVRQAERFGDKPLLTIGGTTHSFADVRRRAGRMGALLRKAGIRSGDRVAIICGNRLEFLDLFLGCAWINAVAVPINQFSRGPQLRHILENSGARLLAADADAVLGLEHIDPSGLPLEDIWCLDSQGPPTAATGGWALRPMPELEAYIDPVPAEPGDTASIIYTSGTTGPSKGVCCPHAQFFWWAVQSIDLLEITTDDVLLTTLPLYHVNALGTFFQALVSGSTAVVLERFSASRFATSLAEHEATVTYLLGAMVSILLSTPASKADRAHATTRALTPGVSERLSNAFEGRFGIATIDGYGSTETNFVIGDRMNDQKRGSMGRVRPGFRARVVDPNGRDVPPGTPGELVIASDIPFAVATGYFNLPGATQASWRDGWFHTGDRVRSDEDGYFYFIDRIKDAIRRRGENISAFEVEQVLLSHPAVANAAVFPVRSDLTEDEVMAAVVLREGATLPPASLLDFCQGRMTYFSIPRYIVFMPDLPTTENGKIQKYRLREMGVTSDTWDREAAGYEVTRSGKREFHGARTKL